MRILGDMYSYPTNSSDFKMWKVKQTKQLLTVTLKDVEVKMMKMKIFECPTDAKDTYVVPLLHAAT